MNAFDGYLPLPEAAKRTPYCTAYFRQLVQTGKVPGVKKIGPAWFVHEATLKTWLDSGATANKNNIGI